jgi:hypothetical protein
MPEQPPSVPNLTERMLSVTGDQPGAKVTSEVAWLQNTHNWSWDTSVIIHHVSVVSLRSKMLRSSTGFFIILEFYYFVYELCNPMEFEIDI